MEEANVIWVCGMTSRHLSLRPGLGPVTVSGRIPQSCVSGARSSGAAVPPGQVQWRQQGTASGRGKSWDLGGRQMWVPCDLGKKALLSELHFLHLWYRGPGFSTAEGTG